ncbi:MAG: dehypoxanthine futalosine cyclase [bacterium]|nr:dehypoxanthine futalosine cyclase [bacterium]
MSRVLNERDTVTIEKIVDKVYEGEPLTFEEGVWLFRYPRLPEIAALANHVRERIHPRRIVTYVVGRIINYTNVCWVRCKFCSFYRVPGHDEGYTLSMDEIFAKIRELVEKGGVEVLIQGGLNPRLKIDYYERLFSAIRESFPQVIIHALSPTEILYIAHISRLSLEQTLRRLQQAGLQSIPGGGGEILVDRVRQQIAPYKHTVDEWLECMRVAHGLGIHSTATMMFGHVETTEDRVEHLLRIRELQAETGGFRAFIAWNFQPEETELPHISKATGYDYLRTVAVARLMLHNVPNLQASILTQGPKITQIALGYGVNDLGSIMIEENVVSAAGSKFIPTAAEMERLIRDAGYEPRRRNTRYELLE